jgi:pyruvate formate lyase activating enzyme
MKIGGLQKISLIDYPGLICAIVFLQGCNFRCPYCHNPELVAPGLFQPCIKENEILEFLATRRGKLDAVTITGGEPTLHSDLPTFIKKIREMGFAVKLDTNGSQPQVIQTFLDENLLNFIAMDVKGPLEKYEAIAGVPVAAKKIKESIRIILKAAIPHEFRTTIVQSQLTPADIFKTAKLISGAERYALQKFVPAKTLNKKFSDEKSYSEEELDKIKKRLEKEMTSVIVR